MGLTAGSEGMTGTKDPGLMGISFESVRSTGVCVVHWPSPADGIPPPPPRALLPRSFDPGATGMLDRPARRAGGMPTLLYRPAYPSRGPGFHDGCLESVWGMALCFTPQVTSVTWTTVMAATRPGPGRQQVRAGFSEGGGRVSQRLPSPAWARNEHQWKVGFRGVPIQPSGGGCIHSSFLRCLDAINK